MNLDADRRLALAYVSAAARPALEALWRLDVTFASILATGTDRMIGRIRLAWWREALETLDREAAPAEPLLRALQARVLPSGISGAALAAMEEGFDDLDAPVLRVTDQDVPLPYAANLEKIALIKVDDVVAAARKVMYR